MEKLEEVDKDMKPRFIEDLGMRFMTETSKWKARFGLYECQYCGEEFEAITKNIKKGNTRSCGCLKGEAHGLTSHKFYQTWYNMKYRCFKVTNKEYKNYGARGITVCEEWLNVSNFVAWCDLTYPNLEGYTLDRIDNDKGYSPENCTWSDRTTQAINQRIMKNNKSGYVGVSYYSKTRVWTAYISVNNTRKHLGYFNSVQEAVQARDNYIVENKLPHKLSGLTKNEKGNK